MNKRKFIAFAAGIPLLVLILIIIILVSEPKPGGISRAAAYKSAALLLTDAESCEQLLKEQGQNYFTEKDRNHWYAKYLNYLYVNGYVSPDTTPSDPEYVQGYLTYREAEELAEALSPGQGELVVYLRQPQKRTGSRWQHKGTEYPPLRYAHEYKERSGLDRIYERRQIPL